MSTSSQDNRKALSSNPQDAFVESFRRQTTEVVTEAQDAVTSGAWVYPVRGVVYLLSHPKLLQPLIPTLTKGLLISFGVIAAMFFFTYLPQVAVLAIVTGPLAFIGAIPLVLGECYLVILFLSKTLLFGAVESDLFDAVLLAQNHTALVQKGRLLGPANKSGKVTQLGRAITKPLTGKLSTDGIVRYIISLPLNLIPVVGTVFFLGYNGMKSGPSCHARYFQLKGFDKTKRSEFVAKRRGAYTAFGTVAMALNLIPIVSMFFQLSTAVGAALWASDIENKSGSGVGGGGSKKTASEEIEVELQAPSKVRKGSGKKEL